MRKKNEDRREERREVHLEVKTGEAHIGWMDWRRRREDGRKTDGGEGERWTREVGSCHS